MENEKNKKPYQDVIGIMKVIEEGLISVITSVTIDRHRWIPHQILGDQLIVTITTTTT